MMNKKRLQDKAFSILARRTTKPEPVEVPEPQVKQTIS